MLQVVDETVVVTDGTPVCQEPGACAVATLSSVAPLDVAAFRVDHVPSCPWSPSLGFPVSVGNVFFYLVKRVCSKYFFLLYMVAPVVRYCGTRKPLVVMVVSLNPLGVKTCTTFAGESEIQVEKLS